MNPAHMRVGGLDVERFVQMVFNRGIGWARDPEDGAAGMAEGVKDPAIVLPALAEVADDRHRIDFVLIGCNHEPFEHVNRAAGIGGAND